MTAREDLARMIAAADGEDWDSRQQPDDLGACLDAADQIIAAGWRPVTAETLRAALRAEYDAYLVGETNDDEFGWLNDDDPRSVQIDGWVNLERLAGRIGAAELL